MLYRLSILILLCLVCHFTQAQGTTSASSKEATAAGEMRALTWDMGTFYASADREKAERIIYADVTKFEVCLLILHNNEWQGMSKSALFIVDKLWEAYKRNILSPPTPGSIKLASAQTTQLMSACEYLRETLDRESVPASRKRNAR